MECRYGPQSGGQAVAYDETVRVVRFVPAGHVLGSGRSCSSIRASERWCPAIQKRRPDPTCPCFVPVPCDIFITEATFGLPVFRHPDTGSEIDRLLQHRHSDRALLLVGALCAGQGAAHHHRASPARLSRARLSARRALGGCRLYEELGVELGELRPATGAPKDELKGRIVIAPPSALNDRWSRRLPDPVTAMASGWMRIRQRAAAQRRAAADHFRSCRLGRADHDHPRTRAARSLDHPRPRGSAEALVHDPPDQGLRAEPRRLRRRGRLVRGFHALDA